MGVFLPPHCCRWAEGVGNDKVGSLDVVERRPVLLQIDAPSEIALRGEAVICEIAMVGVDM
jgi:hypothetical protein